MASRLAPQTAPHADTATHALPRLKPLFNVDMTAIGIALLLAALIRLNVEPRLGW